MFTPPPLRKPEKPILEDSRAETVEDITYEQLVAQIGDIDKFVHAQVRRAESLQEQSLLLSRDDLYQVALIKLFDLYKKMLANDKDWLQIKTRIMEKDGLSEEDFSQRQIPIFLGWAKAQIRWTLFDEAERLLGKPGSYRRGGNVRTDNESSLNPESGDDEGGDDGRTVFDLVSIGMELNPEAIDDQSLEDFERLFGIEIDTDRSHEEAQRLRGKLFNIVRTLLLERRNAPGKGTKPGENEIAAFEAYFVERQPLAVVAEAKGLKYNSLLHSIPIIVDFLSAHRDEIIRKMREK